MKTQRSILVLVVAGILSFSCTERKYSPDSAVKTTLKSMFPNAYFVEWEMEAGYIHAEFTYEGNEKDVWFDMDGKWLMTETDIRASKIPAAIKTALTQTKYADWRIDDVDYIEFYNADPVYVLDVEKGESEVSLYFAPDGTLKQEKNEKDIEHHLP